VFNFVPEAYDNDMALNAFSPLHQINRKEIPLKWEEKAKWFKYLLTLVVYVCVPN